MEQGVGVEIIGPNHQLSMALEQSLSIFQAKVFIIDICAIENFNKGMGVPTYIH